MFSNFWLILLTISPIWLLEWHNRECYQSHSDWMQADVTTSREATTTVRKERGVISVMMLKMDAGILRRVAMIRTRRCKLEGWWCTLDWQIKRMLQQIVPVSSQLVFGRVGIGKCEDNCAIEKIGLKLDIFIKKDSFLKGK
jgi:hypothetical protein